MTEEEKIDLIERLATNLVQRGLGSASILFLEMHKPVTFVASQAAIVFSPMLVPFLGFDRVDQYSQLFQSRENLERLIQRIEELEVERQLAKRASKQDAK